MLDIEKLFVGQISEIPLIFTDDFSMSNKDFIVGDVVVLKSGSQKMTVEEVKDSDVVCVWMNDNVKCSGTFKKDMIKKVDSPDNSPDNSPDYSKGGLSKRFRQVPMG